MSNEIMVLIAERDAAKRRARNHLEKLFQHRVGSPNYEWNEARLEDALKEHVELCAAIEAERYLNGHAVTVDNLQEYKR